MTNEARTYRMEKHAGWGNHIEWFEYPTQVWGHLPRKPVIGDYITSKMKSGKIGVFKVTAVRYEYDPPDMFFADTEPLGYEDELPSVPEEQAAPKRLLLS